MLTPTTENTAEGVDAKRVIRLLTLSSVFPNPSEPGSGVFVRRRLQHVAAHCEVKVIAPVPVIDYSNPGRKFFHGLSVCSQRWDDGIEVLHPRWIFPPFGTPANVFCLFFRLIWLMMRLRKLYPFQLIDSHFGYPDGASASLLAAALHCPFIVTLRGNEPVFGESRLKRRFLAWSLRRAARVISVSEELRQYAISLGVDPIRAKAIPNGIDTSVFYPRDRSLRQQYKIAADTRVILSAGHLIRDKGHHRIIRAVKTIHESGTDVELLIAGGPGREDRFEPQLRQLASELGLERRVRFLGQISPSALAELMSCADVFCLASSMEGWPNVVHEALGCGTPVVATAVGGVPDMIPSEEYGLVIPRHDQKALEEALQRALQKPWDRAAIALWGQSRSWEDVALEVVDQVRQVLSEAAEESNVRD